MRGSKILPCVESLESLTLCATGAGTAAFAGLLPAAEIKVQAAAEHAYATLSVMDSANKSLSYRIQFINPNNHQILLNQVAAIHPKTQQAWFHVFPAPGVIPTIKVSFEARQGDPSSITTTYLTPKKFTLNHPPGANFINQNSVTYHFRFNAASGTFSIA